MFEENQVKNADKLYEKNAIHIKSSLFFRLKMRALNKEKFEEIKALLTSFEFKQAGEIWKEVRDKLGNRYDTIYESIRFECSKIFFSEKLIPLLKSYKFPEAEKLWNNAGHPLIEEYERLKGEYEKEFYLSDFEKLLKQFRFKESDDKWNNSGALYSSDYESIKSDYIKQYFYDKFGLTLDNEQVTALLKMSDSTLVTARAGSGKTRTLTAKAVLLVNKYNIDPNHILLLAFNTNAAKEIKSRISEMCPGKKFNNIRTFHSLSCGILDRPDIEPNPERFVDLAIKNLLSDNGGFKKSFYQYFKNDIAKIENGLTDEEYHSIRNKGVSIIDCSKVYISLGGRYVKSRAEKWIADFLFEHDLTHEGQKVWNAYEKPHRNTTADGVGIIKPDFTLGWDKKYSFLLEHWAINEMGYFPDNPIWENGKMTYKKYDELRKW